MGFFAAGISKARRLDDEARKLEQWLGQGMQGKMSYLERNFEKRVDPRKLVPGAKSVISLLYNYCPSKTQNPDAPKLAKYAYGEDYHFVLKRKLKTLLREMRKEFGDFEGRCFVDSAPVMERDWAKHSGVGWVGKNTLIIHPKAGSYFFLAELIVDLEFEYDGPISDYCGSCRKCIDACPTDAISDEGYLLDARKCISYLTIELREAIPEEFKGKMEDWAFGCDICQDVCPWNRFSKPHREEAFEPKDDLMEMEREAWHEITAEVFRDLFRKSAVKRTKFEGLKRNLAFLGE
jgi:epoxyqueuosine reductase